MDFSQFYAQLCLEVGWLVGVDRMSKINKVTPSVHHPAHDPLKAQVDFCFYTGYRAGGDPLRLSTMFEVRTADGAEVQHCHKQAEKVAWCLVNAVKKDSEHRYWVRRRERGVVD